MSIGVIMFSYYGSKSKIIDLYPSPKHDKIIEPFAGSARYALKWFDRDVLLVDKYEVIIKIWHYLQQASKKDIFGLPEPSYKQSINDFNLAEGERLLMSFLVARGVASSQYIVQKFSDIKKAKADIARQLYKIQHWEVRLGGNESISNKVATWFIDPPYQSGGHNYHFGNKEINYTHLAQWCKSRQGQIIVCENTKSDWLPFWPMRKMSGAYSKTTEAIWSNHRTGFEVIQNSLPGMFDLLET